jgi:hypothetical protein
MFLQPIFRRLSTGLAVTSLLFPATPPRREAPEATPSRVQTKIVQIGAENAAIRDELRTERQRMLLQPGTEAAGWM